MARDFILDTCVNSLGTDPLCARITREAVGTPRPRTPGTVFSIDTLPLNAAAIETSGVDVALGYALEFGGAQRLGVSLAYTYLDKLTLQQQPQSAAGEREGPARRRPGRLGAGFEHRANLGLNYSWDRFSASWRMNYLSAIKDTLEENGPTRSAGTSTTSARWCTTTCRRATSSAPTASTRCMPARTTCSTRSRRCSARTRESEITGTETAADTYDPFGRMWYAGVEVTF